MIAAETRGKRLSALFLGAALFFPCILARADLQAEMESLFDGMIATAAPGVYESQRRGVLSGGHAVAKSRVFDANLIAVAPPSWKAGCGGVDLFAGSLSFVNSDQIVQLLRSVAANSAGYAFQLALDNVFPDGAKWIENFQKKIQQLNQYLGNSCQLAQGVVNDLASGFDLKHKTDASLKATFTGLYEDIFSAREESEGESPMEKLKSGKPDEYNKMVGNIVWKQLKRNRVGAWFGHGDDTLLEAILSLTGTVIIGDLVDDPNAPGSGAKTNLLTILPGNQIGLSDLIAGGEVKLYSCAGDRENCLNAGNERKTVSVTGIRERIDAMLLGDAATPGIVEKYASNSGALNDRERAFVSALPDGVGAIVRNLSLLSRDSASLFVLQSSGTIALAMTHDFIEELFRAADSALVNSDSPYKKEALQGFERSRRQVRGEHAVLSSRYGTLAELIGHYDELVDNTRKKQYRSSDAPQDESDSGKE